MIDYIKYLACWAKHQFFLWNYKRKHGCMPLRYEHFYSKGEAVKIFENYTIPMIYGQFAKEQIYKKQLQLAVKKILERKKASNQLEFKYRWNMAGVEQVTLPRSK